MGRAFVRAKSFQFALTCAAFFLAACDNPRVHAEKETRKAEQTLRDLSPAVAAYLPERARELSGDLAKARQSVAEEDYAGAAETAARIEKTASELTTRAAARKAEAKEIWDVLEAARRQIPEVRGRIDSRTGVSQRAELSEIEAAWREADNLMTWGKPMDALNRASQARERLRSLESELGMNPPSR